MAAKYIASLAGAFRWSEKLVPRNARAASDFFELAPRSSFLFGHDLSDLPSPAEASHATTGRCLGFAQTGNRLPLFGIMPYIGFCALHA
jgi:hypothetical protein